MKPLPKLLSLTMETAADASRLWLFRAKNVSASLRCRLRCASLCVLACIALPQNGSAQVCSHGTTVGQLIFSTNCNGQLIFGRARVGSSVAVVIKTLMLDDCPGDQTLLTSITDEVVFNEASGIGFTTSNLVSNPILLPSLGSTSNLVHVRSGTFAGASYLYPVPVEAGRAIRHTVTAFGLDTNSATNPNGLLGGVCSAQCIVLRPHLSITTSCTNSTEDNNLVGFNATVVNDGDCDLTNIFVFVSQPTNNSVVLGPIRLTNGQSHIFSSSYRRNPGSPGPDTITAVGTDELLCSVSATATQPCSLDPLAAALHVTKHCASAVATNVGSSLTVTGLVCNPGQIPFTNVVVVDEQPGISPSATQLLGSLDPGQCKPYSFNYIATGCGTNRDTVTVTAYSTNGVLSTNASAECLLCCPGITVETTVACVGNNAGCPPNAEAYGPTATAIRGHTGDPLLDNPAFCYRIVVHNTGQDPLTNLVVRDDSLGLLQTIPGPLAAGASLILENLRVQSSATTTNTVLASGQCAGVRGNGALVTAAASAVANVLSASLTCQMLLTSRDDLDQNPEDNHVTLPQDGSVHLVTNRVTVCNDGQVDLTNVTLSSAALQAWGCLSPAPFSLGTGQCATIVFCVQTVTNDATFCASNFRARIEVTAETDPGTNTNSFCLRTSSNVISVGVSRIDCLAGAGCVGTPAYWIEHPEAWPAESVSIGGVPYPKAASLSLMKLNNSADKSLILFRQLAAAKLNVLDGADPSCIQETIQAADAWFQTHGAPGSGVRGSSPAWRTGDSLRRVLENYNNGKLCALECGGKRQRDPAL